MSFHAAVRASVVAGLVLVAAACGVSGPAASTGMVATDTLRTSAPSAPVASTSGAASPTTAPSPSPMAVAVPPLEDPLKVDWEAGGPKPPKDGGCCVTVAPDGRIWVSAMFDSRFWIIDQNGKYLESWGTPGSGDGQFDFVLKDDGWGAIAFEPDGSFYVADTGNRRIQKFGRDRQFVRAWGSFGTGDGQFATPMYVATDGKGHVYVSDGVRLDVQVFSRDGVFIREHAAGWVTDDLLLTVIDAKGRLYVDNGPTIRVFDADGTELPGIDLSSADSNTAGMAFDAAGHLYVSTIGSYNPESETRGIYELDASRTVVHAWPGDADTLALDPKGGGLYTSYFDHEFIHRLELPKP